MIFEVSKNLARDADLKIMLSIRQ